MATTGPRRGMDLEETRGPTIIATIIVLFLIGTVGIILRLWARQKSKAALWWDDWLVIFAWFPFLGICAGAFVGVHFGAGRHIQWVMLHHPDPFDHLEPFLRYIFSGEILYPFAIVPIKCSISCLYIRLFGIHKSFRWYNYILIIITILWGIINLFGLIFQCSPVQEAWNPLNPTRKGCINLRLYLIGTNVPNVVLDFLLLVAPIHLIWGLHLPMRKKLLIIAVLILGAGETAFSIIRLAKISSLGDTDLTWDYFTAIIWSTVEPSIGLLCVCVPVMGPLLPRSFMDRVTSSGRATGSVRFYQPKKLEDKSYELSKRSGKNSFSRLDGSNQST